jgi:hypothetical protein
MAGVDVRPLTLISRMIFAVAAFDTKGGYRTFAATARRMWEQTKS